MMMNITSTIKSTRKKDDISLFIYIYLYIAKLNCNLCNNMK